MVVFVVLLQDGVRKIPVQYSKKIQGRKQVGGQSTHIPLKVNTSGVIPVIFAQSLLQTPVIIASLLGKGNGTGIGSKILKVCPSLTGVIQMNQFITLVLWYISF